MRHLGRVMQQRTSQILYSYWNDVRGERLAPKRFEIEPARIAPILPETFILERIGLESYRFRLAGTRICEQFCRELRGTNFLNLWDGEDIVVVADQLSSLARHGGVALLQCRATTHLGRSVTLETILLPLMHTRQAITRYLGAMSTTEDPHWLGAEGLVRLELLAHDHIWPDTQVGALLDNAQPPPFSVNGPEASRVVSVARRHFRVYEGGRSKAQCDDA